MVLIQTRSRLSVLPINWGTSGRGCLATTGQAQDELWLPPRVSHHKLRPRPGIWPNVNTHPSIGAERTTQRGQWEPSQPFNPAWIPGNKVLMFDKDCVHRGGSGPSSGHTVDSSLVELGSHPDAGTREGLNVMAGLSHIPSL